jgi:hypothetical protein
MTVKETDREEVRIKTQQISEERTLRKEIDKMNNNLKILQN